MRHAEMKGQLEKYLVWMKEEEKSEATIRQYRRSIERFFMFLNGRDIEKNLLLQYKEQLADKYQPTSVNANLAALNSFFRFSGEEKLHLKLLKIQKKSYSSAERELSKTEYLRLLHTAERNGDRKLSLLIQTICGTGIRVSEVQYITVEAIQKGEAAIRLKGKTRILLIPGKIRKNLQVSAGKRKFKEGRYSEQGMEIPWIG